MNFNYYNPLNRENLGWAVAAIVAMQHYPRLSAALAKSGIYLTLTPFRETYNVGKIFLKEFTKPASQVKPIISKRSVTSIGSRAAPAVRFIGNVAKNPYVAATVASSAVATYGMVKQNPPLLNTDFVTGAPM